MSEINHIFKQENWAEEPGWVHLLYGLLELTNYGEWRAPVEGESFGDVMKRMKPTGFNLRPNPVGVA